MSGVSLNLLRNKRNVCLNLKLPAGRDEAARGSRRASRGPRGQVR